MKINIITITEYILYDNKCNNKNENNNNNWGQICYEDGNDNKHWGWFVMKMKIYIYIFPRDSTESLVNKLGLTALHSTDHTFSYH